MAIADDIQTAVNGNIRRAAAPSSATYTIDELRIYLGGLSDDATASGDDLLDIDSDDPYNRSTSKILTLLNGYNIDDTLAEYLYGGTLTQDSGNVVYYGVKMVGGVESGTETQVVQNGSTLTAFWGTGLNADAALSITNQFLIKGRTGGADIDGLRCRAWAREEGDTFDEFSFILEEGVTTVPISTQADVFYTTASGTIAAWPIANDNEGFNAIDVENDAAAEDFYSLWDLNGQSSPDLYEFRKHHTKRGATTSQYGLVGPAFRGITHEVVVDTPTGTFNAFEALSWGSGATAGTAQMLAINSTTAATKLWMQLLTGVVPTNNVVMTGGTSAATCAMNVTITARTLSKQIAGVSTGSALLGAYGFGVEAADLVAADRLTDLDAAQLAPPNNVTFSITDLTVSESRLLVGPRTGSAMNRAQFATNATYTSATQTSIVVTTAIANDTTASGTIRIERDSGVYSRIAYSSWTGSTFTITSTDFSTDNSTAGNDLYISYIDKLAGSTTESFSVPYVSDRDLFVRIADGGGTPTKRQFILGTLGSGGGSVASAPVSES